jgi:Zn-dependent protease with chaperone function
MYAFGDLTTPCRRPAQRIVYYAGFIREHAFQTGPADIPALPLLVLVVSVLNLVSRPLQNAISRRVERAADRTALELTNDPAAFIRSEVQLARSDLADFAPPRVVVLLLHAHPPPTVERIRMAEAFAARQARSHQCTSPSHSFPAGEPTSEEESDR